MNTANNECLLISLLMLVLLGAGTTLRILASSVRQYATMVCAPRQARLVRNVGMVLFAGAVLVALSGVLLVMLISGLRPVGTQVASATVVAIYLIGGAALSFRWAQSLQDPGRFTTAARYVSYARCMFYLSLLVGIVLCGIASENSALATLLFPVLIGVLIAVSLFDGLQAMAGKMQQTFLNLWQVSLCMRSGRPLSDELLQLADLAFGRRAMQLRTLSEELKSGGDPAVALDNTELLSSLEGAELSAGLKSGKLAETLQQLLQRRTQLVRALSATQNPMALILDSWLVLLAVFATVTFLGYFITPKFKRIFEHFEVPLPPLTQAVTATLEFVAAWMGVLTPLVLLALFASSVWAFAPMTGPIDRVERYLAGLWPRSFLPHVLRALATTVESQFPLEMGLEPFLRRRLSAPLRDRRQNVRESVIRGEDCWTSLMQQKLLTPAEESFLHSARRVGNLPWALRFISSRLEVRRRHALLLGFEVIQPIVVLLVGLSVGSLAVAYFLPLISLMNELL